MTSYSGRKAAILDHSERYAATRENWRKKSAFFHREDEIYLRFLIPEGVRVLEIGCGTGDTLAALSPSHGVGVDFSPGMIEQARRQHPNFTFHVGDAEDPATIASLAGPFDVILVQDTIGSLDDDLLPNLPSFISRVRSGFGPCWGGLRTRSV